MTREGESRLTTRLCRLLGCRFPVLQAGMGGVARSELVAAVIEAGGYGFLGMVREAPALIAAEIDRVRLRSERPFGVNLIPAATDSDLFAAELEICFEKRVPALCFFWKVDTDAVARAKDAGCQVLYQVGSVEDAVAAAEAGADAVIAQGWEAGGHVRGGVASVVLLPQVAQAIPDLPVVASGGFASGAGLAAALALGADGIPCGTAFLCTEESYAHDYHKRRVLEGRSEDTVHTDAFAINWPAGSAVRVLANSVTQGLGPNRRYGHRPESMPREAVAEQEGRPIYRFSTDSPLRDTLGDVEALALFAGQAAGLVQDLPSAGDRLRRIASEAERVLDRLGCRQ